MPFLERREIGEHKLGVNDFDVANRINRRADVMNIAVLETAHHLDDRVNFANMMQKLIA